MSFELLIWEIWSKHSKLLLDNFQQHNLELCPIFENFLGALETQFDRNFFMQVVLPYVYFVQKFESHPLDQYNSSYDLNNGNYSSSVDSFETDFRDPIVPFDEFSGSNGVKIWIYLFQEDLFS